MQKAVARYAFDARGKALLLILVLAVFGCSKTEEGRMTVYPVSGRVTVNGQPAGGAIVVFYGATPDLTGPGTPAPEGTTDAHGEFRLRSYDPDDGAPAGEFKVTVIWPEPIPPGADREMYQPKDRLQGRYSNPQKSNLTATVEEGGGELPPFEL
jgi:hypothetical protein